MKHNYLFYGGIILLSTLDGCQSNAGEINSLGQDVESVNIPQESMVTKVAVSLVEEKNLVQEIETSGIIQARQAADAVWGADGIIADLRVKNGQRVQKGQVLAILENRKENLQLEKAKITLKEKQINYESESLGSDSLRLNYLGYLTGVAMAEVVMEEAKWTFEQTTLRAPISGIVNDLVLSVGAKVKAGEAFCHIWNSSKLDFVGHIMETQLISLQKEQICTIQPLGSQKSYRATLVEINPKVNKHGLVQVRLQLKDAKDLLYGRHAKAFIEVPHEQKLVIPKDALVFRSDKPVIFVYSEGLAKWTYVITGRENGREIEILEGLQKNDSVIVTNNLQLSHNAQVSLVTN